MEDPASLMKKIQLIFVHIAISCLRLSLMERPKNMVHTLPRPHLYY